MGHWCPGTIEIRNPVKYYRQLVDGIDEIRDKLIQDYDYNSDLYDDDERIKLNLQIEDKLCEIIRH